MPQGVLAEDLRELYAFFDPPCIEWRIAKTWYAPPRPIKLLGQQLAKAEQDKAIAEQDELKRKQSQRANQTPDGKDWAEGNRGQQQRKPPPKQKPAANAGQLVIHAAALPYVDDRAVMDRLDYVCGRENWRNEFVAHPAGAQYGLLCGLSIKIRGDDGNTEWVTKWDAGGLRSFEPAKAAVSDSEKRAACKWGVGRYLYLVGLIEVDVAIPDATGACHLSFDQTSFTEEKENSKLFRWRYPLLPRSFWPAGYVPPGMEQRITKAKAHIEQAISGRRFDELDRLLTFAHGSPDFGESHLAELRASAVLSMNKRQPDGELPGIARRLYESNLLLEAEFKQVLDRAEECLRDEVRHGGNGNSAGTS